MKRIMALLAAASVLLTGLAGCKDKESSSSEPAESSMLEVMIPLEMPDIEITIPESYEMTSTQSNNTVYIKEDASVIINSDVFTDEYKTLDEYVEFAKETYRTYANEVEFLSEERSSDSKTVIEYVYSLYSENGVFKKYCMVGFFTDGEKIYLVTCKADEDTYEGYREEFLDIIGSVSV